MYRKKHQTRTACKARYQYLTIKAHGEMSLDVVVTSRSLWFSRGSSRTSVLSGLGNLDEAHRVAQSQRTNNTRMQPSLDWSCPSAKCGRLLLGSSSWSIDPKQRQTGRADYGRPRKPSTGLVLGSRLESRSPSHSNVCDEPCECLLNSPQRATSSLVGNRGACAPGRDCVQRKSPRTKSAVMILAKNHS